MKIIIKLDSANDTERALTGILEVVKKDELWNPENLPTGKRYIDDIFGETNIGWFKIK